MAKALILLRRTVDVIESIDATGQLRKDPGKVRMVFTRYEGEPPPGYVTDTITFLRHEGDSAVEITPDDVAALTDEVDYLEACLRRAVKALADAQHEAAEKRKILRSVELATGEER
jgi:hypothetical protein